jgi:hypothetical protein
LPVAVIVDPTTVKNFTPPALSFAPEATASLPAEVSTQQCKFLITLVLLEISLVLLLLGLCCLTYVGSPTRLGSCLVREMRACKKVCVVLQPVSKMSPGLVTSLDNNSPTLDAFAVKSSAKDLAARTDPAAVAIATVDSPNAPAGDASPDAEKINISANALAPPASNSLQAGRELTNNVAVCSERAEAGGAGADSVHDPSSPHNQQAAEPPATATAF